MISTPGVRAVWFSIPALTLGIHPPLSTLDRRSFVWDKIRDKRRLLFCTHWWPSSGFSEMSLGFWGRLCGPFPKILQRTASLPISFSPTFTASRADAPLGLSGLHLLLLHLFFLGVIKEQQECREMLRFPER